MRNLFKLLCLLVVAVLITSCSTNRKRAKVKAQVVPIAINIKGQSHELTGVNLDVFRFKLLQDLQQFQRVDLELVDTEENPEIILDLDIVDLTIWPKDERTSRRTFRRNIVVGTNAQGKAVYQTVSATVDITQTIIRTNARFSSRLTFKNQTPAVFERSFSPRYSYSNVSIGNVYGDSRAVDPSIYSARSINIDPTTEDFLEVLSRQEMVRRLSDEIRKRYR